MLTARTTPIVAALYSIAVLVGCGAADNTDDPASAMPNDEAAGAGGSEFAGSSGDAGKGGSSQPGTGGTKNAGGAVAHPTVVPAADRVAARREE